MLMVIVGCGAVLPVGFEHLLLGALGGWTRVVQHFGSLRSHRRGAVLHHGRLLWVVLPALHEQEPGPQRGRRLGRL